MTNTATATPARSAGLRSHPVLGLLLVALAVVLVMQGDAFRSLEATLMAPLVGLALQGSTVPVGSAITIGVGSDSVYRLVITSLCSTAVLFVPLLVLAGAILLLPRFSRVSVIKGLLAGLAISAAANLVRYGLAAWALQQWGMPGFDVVHRWIGSLLVIVAFAFAFFVMLRVSTNGRMRTRRPPRAAGPDA